MRRFRVVRAKESQFFPTRSLAHRIDALAREVGADVIFLDPWLPLGQLGPRLRAAPYVVVVHGAEVTVPGRLPGSRASRRARVAPRRGSRRRERVLGARSGARGAAPTPWRRRPAGRRRRSVPTDRRRRAPRRAACVRARRGAAARGRHEPSGAAQGLRRAHRRSRRAARRAARDRGRGPRPPAARGAGREAPRWAVGCGSSAGCPTARWRRSSRAPTCSRCRAATGGSVSKPRASASCSSKRPPRACRRSRGAAADRTKPSSTAPPASSSTGGAHARFAARSRKLIADPELRARMGNAARVRAVSEFSYDQLVTRLAPLAAGDLSARSLT